MGYFELYGAFLLMTYVALSKFNVTLLLLFFFDYLLHWIVRLMKKRWNVNHIFLQWIKKFIFVPSYHFILGDNSLIPLWVLSIPQILIMTIYDKDTSMNTQKFLCFVGLTTEAALSMYYFSGNTIEYVICFEAFSTVLKQVKEQYLRYKNLVDFIHGVLIIVDDNSTINYVNQGILKYKVTDLHGKSLQDFPFYNKKKLDLLKKNKVRQRGYFMVCN
eukprot:gene10840-3460_t